MYLLQQVGSEFQLPSPHAMRRWQPGSVFSERSVTDEFFVVREKKYHFCVHLSTKLIGESDLMWFRSNAEQFANSVIDEPCGSWVKS